MKIKINNKSFGFNVRRASDNRKSGGKTWVDSKNTISPSASLIYKNNFYQSTHINRRESRIQNENNNSYSSYMINQQNKKRKIRSREQKGGLQIKITKLKSKLYIYAFTHFHNK